MGALSLHTEKENAVAKPRKLKSWYYLYGIVMVEGFAKKDYYCTVDLNASRDRGERAKDPFNQWTELAS